jgi:hypothetical protein
MRKRKVYTGNPVGTYEYGDKHPEMDMYFAGQNGRYERWLTLEEFQASFLFRHRRDVAKDAKLSKVCKRKQTMQTGNPVGTYKGGDRHPSIAGRFFIQYSRGIEVWGTEDMMRRRMESCRMSYKKRYKAVPVEVKAQGEAWRDCYWSEYRRSRDYDNAYVTYGKRVDRYWVPPHERAERDKIRKAKRAERRRRYRLANPAKRKEDRLARKGLVNKLWRNLTDMERGRANMRYKWRNLLNDLHGSTVFVVDHICPLAKGGTQHPDNLRVTTYRYNEWKSDRDVNVQDFYASAVGA